MESDAPNPSKEEIRRRKFEARHALKPGGNRDVRDRMELFWANQVLQGGNHRDSILLHALVSQDVLSFFDQLQRSKFDIRTLPGHEAPTEDEKAARIRAAETFRDSVREHGSATIGSVTDGMPLRRWPNDLDLLAAPGSSVITLEACCSEYAKSRHSADGAPRVAHIGFGVPDEHYKKIQVQAEKKAKGVHSTSMLVSLTPDAFRTMLRQQQHLFLPKDVSHMEKWVTCIQRARESIYYDSKEREVRWTPDGKPTPAIWAFNDTVVNSLNQEYEARLQAHKELGGAWIKHVRCTPERLHLVIGLDCRMNEPYPLLHPQGKVGASGQVDVIRDQNALTEAVKKFQQLAGGMHPDRMGPALADFGLRYDMLENKFMLEGKSSQAFADYFRTLILLHMPAAAAFTERSVESLLPDVDVAALPARKADFIANNNHRYQAEKIEYTYDEIDDKGFYRKVVQQYDLGKIYDNGVKHFCRLREGLSRLSEDEKAYLREMRNPPDLPPASEKALLAGMMNFQGAFSPQPQRVGQTINEEEMAAFHTRLKEHIAYARQCAADLRAAKGLRNPAG